jgi:hypothetical protein
MSFPDFLDNNTNNNNPDIVSDPFQPSSSSFEPPIDSRPNENQFDFISSNVQQNNESPQIISSIEQIPLDNEEQQRIEQRQIEETTRRKVITAKMELELKLKNENREKANAYMREFEQRRTEEIAKRKEMNIRNEKDFIEEKKMIKEGKKNSWECVMDNIAVKDSDYKGSKDVSRMKNVIINRKNDNNLNTMQSEILFN